MPSRLLETCLTPALFKPEEHHESIVVVIDILRASSAICAAFEHGVKSIIPVADVATAKDYKSRGFLVAAERDGIVLDFADFGNSPLNFTRENVSGKTLVYSTTNGTGIIEISKDSFMTVIGSFNNISALTDLLLSQDKPVLLFCAGWKNRFNIEDTVCAGAIAEKLMESRLYNTICDSTNAAIDLWTLAKNDLMKYIDKAAHRKRLRDKGLDDCLEYCLTRDLTRTVPVIKNGVLVNNN